MKYRIAQDIETQNYLIVDPHNKIVDYFNYSLAAYNRLNQLNKRVV